MVVEVPSSTDYNRGYAIFPQAASGDTQQFFRITGNTHVLKRKIRLTRAREVVTGIGFEPAFPHPDLAAKVKALEKEVTDLTSLVTSGIADEARLNLAQRKLDVAKLGQRIKFCSGTVNHPFPSPVDIGNVYTKTACASMWQKQASGQLNYLRFKIDSTVGVQRKAADAEYWAGTVVAVKHTQGGTKVNSDGKTNTDSIRTLDVRLVDGELIKGVPVEEAILANNQVILGGGASKSYLESMEKTLAKTEKSLEAKATQIHTTTGKVKGFEKTCEKGER